MFASLSNNNANVYDNLKLIITHNKLAAIILTGGILVTADIVMKYLTIIKRASSNMCAMCAR